MLSFAAAAMAFSCAEDPPEEGWKFEPPEPRELTIGSAPPAEEISPPRFSVFPPCGFLSVFPCLVPKDLNQLFMWEYTVCPNSGLGVQNCWHCEPAINDFVVPPVSLTAMDLRGAKMERTTFELFECQGCQLQGASFEDSVLAGANLWSADLRGAKLWHVDLTGADLFEADLRGADFQGADLTGARVDCARMDGAAFLNATCPDGEPAWKTEESCKHHSKWPCN